MKVERYDSVRAAEACLREAGGNGSSSQTFSVLRAVERCFWRCLPYTAIRCPRYAMSCLFARRRPFRVYSVRDEKGVVLCAPLHLGTDGEWSVVAGEIVELDFVDFLYSRRSSRELDYAFRAVMHEISEDGIKRIAWRYLESEGVTASILRSWPHSKVETFPNVRILFQDGLAGYMRSLGANARSNLKKARNRLRRDGKGLSFSFRSSVGIGEPMDGRAARAQLRRCRSVYLKRQRSRYRNGGFLARLFFQRGSYVALSVPGEGAFFAALEIDGCIAAYMEGYVNMSRLALEVPRIAMNDKFGRYSPGWILIVEAVSWLCENSDIRTIDLCRGDERYKLDLGGICYSTESVQACTEVTE